MLSSQFVAPSNSQNTRLSTTESELVQRVNGTNAYNYDLQLERIAFDHNLSGYGFRSGGSKGATETAKWIKEKFQSFSLETTEETFEFTTWDLPTQPSLVIDEDGNAGTTDDQRTIESFQSEHLSWPTLEGGMFKDLVILPLPDARSFNEIGKSSLYGWSSVDITGKIVLIGREIQMNRYWQEAYASTLKAQRPAAVIYTWWYDWLSFVPPFFSSIGGRPISSVGSYYWDQKIPVGWVNYEDGLWLREEENSHNVSARVNIPSVIGVGPHYNVIGKLRGSESPDKFVIISGHYDTVMTSGFSDNGAGTSGVIELARIFSEAVREGKYTPKYTMLFIAFASEEFGFVGSINYIKQHQSEMQNIIAVINLDSIGSDSLEVSEMFTSDGGLDLNTTLFKAAEDLGVGVRFIEPGGSDQEAFRNPTLSNTEYNEWWGLDAGINDVPRVKASTMISSYPLFYRDNFPGGNLGWIHTGYDNSTSSNSLNWVEADDLEKQIQFSALVVARVQAYSGSLILTQIFIVSAVTIAAVGAVMFVKSKRARGLIKNAKDDILYYIEAKHLIVFIFLAVIFLLGSFIIHFRSARIEILVHDYPTPTGVGYYGFPLEMMVFSYNTRWEPANRPAQTQWVTAAQQVEEDQSLGEGFVAGTTFMWDRVFLDVAFWVLLAFGFTYLGARIAEKFSRPEYDTADFES